MQHNEHIHNRTANEKNNKMATVQNLPNHDARKWDARILNYNLVHNAHTT